ncbi:MAG: spike base protein, RCAP_Rcc01079 family [Pikeienuella sp.]
MAFSEKTNINTAVGGHSITPSDDDIVEPMARALWIGTTGNVAVVGPDGTTATYPNVPVGELAVQAVKVLATGTTASSIVAMH